MVVEKVAMLFHEQMFLFLFGVGGGVGSILMNISEVPVFKLVLCNLVQILYTF